ncbi:hypothetical protein M5K25_018843 [Dendrobium thyrsiflorum]|uniref:Uncharacterized protein n=1 Tax=Dendrobium thyrsiflorum TaxID=117978 RepID=A0ABD0UDG1_DENTH
MTMKSAIGSGGSPIVPQWKPLSELPEWLTFFTGHVTTVVVQLCNESFPFVTLTLITESTAMP